MSETLESIGDITLISEEIDYVGDIILIFGVGRSEVDTFI
jgi:hypothetical protein